MARFHFVEDYERHVAALIAAHPLDEAMSLAVGGHYEELGRIEAAMLRTAGLRRGMRVFDLGCGSGRLAATLGAAQLDLSYHGTDVVQALLDYAATRSPPHFRFTLHPELSIPAADGTVDLACAFSVFTHLLHHETFVYLAEMQRVLKSGGLVVFSFLEFAAPSHWVVFESTIEAQRHSRLPALNQFIERNAIVVWAAHLGFEVMRFIDGHVDTGAGPLGQSAVVLRLDR
jgi:ubiquinone/menaquinone biosynthesis C-methylase UbiE